MSMFRCGGGDIHPTTITPSNTNPVALHIGDIDLLAGSGFAIESKTDVTVYGEFENVSLSGSAPYGALIDSVPNVAIVNHFIGTLIPSAQGTSVSAGVVDIGSPAYIYDRNMRPTETELWTNPNTSANFSANTEVTLSDDITNYDLLKFTWKCKTADADSSAVAAYISPTDLITCGDYSSTANKPKFTIGSRTSGIHARMVSATSNTKIKFQGAAALNATGIVINESIPIKIVGLKNINF